MRYRSKKSLGQNFLIDKNIINTITDVGNIDNNDIVIEVGPGSGVLTQSLLDKKPKNIKNPSNMNWLQKILGSIRYFPNINFFIS